MLCQLGPRGASSDAGAQRTTRDKYDASVGCSAAKGPGRLRDDRLFSSDDITTRGINQLYGRPSLHGEVTALLPSSLQVRSRGARAVGLIGRDGPALRRRPRSLEAGLLLRLRAGTWARTCGGGPCCLLSSLRASAPARGMRVRGSARTGRGGNRDGPSLASHRARAAERAAHADTDGHASSSRAEVPDARTATAAEARRGAITTTEAAVATRTEQRAAATAARRDTGGLAGPRASAGASAAPASVRVARTRRARRRAGARRSPCSRMPAQRLRRARAGRRIRLAAAHVADARAPRQQQQQRTCSARRLWATRVSVRAESAREMGRVVRWGGRGRGLLSRVRSCTVAARHVREGGSWGGWGSGDWGWGETRLSPGLGGATTDGECG